MTAWGKMISQYEGHCVWCDCLWPVGATIYFQVGLQGYYCSDECLQCAIRVNEPVGGITTPPAPVCASTGTATRPTGIREGLTLAEQVSIYTTGYQDGFRDGRKAA